jgi:hypothetical protein
VRRLAVLTASLVLAALPAVSAPAAGAPSVPGPNNAEPVTVRVVDVLPTTPKPSDKPLPLTVTLQLTNTTERALEDLQVQAVRGNPIVTQQALDEAIVNPQPPDPTLAGRFEPTAPVTTSLAPGQTQTVTFASSTDRLQGAGLCICQNRIYPLYFSVLHEDDSGALVPVGAGQTFIPSFGDFVPEPLQVSWVWPLLERPHRLADDTVFLDDDLAASVAPGGRLDRLLEVVERAGKRVPMTLLTDPDLIDELAVMGSGNYRVRSGDGTRPGTGADAARAWLDRLRTVLDTTPGLELAFTAFADPDVDSLTGNGLDWAQSLDRKAQARVTDELGGRTPLTDIAWPTDGTLQPATLAALVRKGTPTVLVSDSVLPGGSDAQPVPDALAPVQTQSGAALLAVTSSDIQPYAAQVMSRTGPGLAALPLLVSEVALRAVQDGTSARYLVITPPRDLDPDPLVATRALVATAHTIWSQPLPLRAAVRTVTPVDHGQLVDRPGRQLPAETIDTARYVTNAIPSLTTMFPVATDARNLLGELPAAVQRIESSSWLSDPQQARAIADRLRKRVSRIAEGVHLLTPATGTYTLGSQDSPLPISIENTLDVPVQIRVQLHAVGGLPGFTAGDIGVQRIAAGAKLGLHIPVQVERAGRIKVQVTLTTPDRTVLGDPIVLSVRSTALGTIGKIITIVAGVILALALAVRLARRWRHHRRAASATAAG